MVDRVVDKAPCYFDAFDLKAAICVAQGQPEEAQKVLEAVAEKTPRNYVRKRKLATAAMLNGDAATAAEIMEDVVKNDTVPGAVLVRDKIALARTWFDEGSATKAKKILMDIPAEKLVAATLEEKISHASLLAASYAGGARAGGFDQLREVIEITELPATTRLDVLRAGLSMGDIPLVEQQTKILLASKESKANYVLMRKLYGAYSEEQMLKSIQKDVAMASIKPSQTIEAEVLT